MAQAMTQQWMIPTKMGSLFLLASEKGLRQIFWNRQASHLPKKLDVSIPTHAILFQAAKELSEYFDGDRQKFHVPLDLEGTDFQQQVWQELLKIPFGETRSYSDVAKAIKNAKAVRGVGTANGRNPLCIIVPCHRVITADGKLGGYSGGLDKKVGLLRIEKSYRPEWD